MSYVANDLTGAPQGFEKKYKGKLIGTGHCVPFVQEATKAPHTGLWKRGEKVRDNKVIRPGTAIATFDSEGTYKNNTDGTSHAAIYVQQDAVGIQVWDQWKTRADGAGTRWIRFEPFGKSPKPVNDGDSYYVIE